MDGDTPRRSANILVVIFSGRHSWPVQITFR
ncbi:hypothetical protein W823_17075 [Williamsia sp. D3]|nr:hypothetical protein W823_17075 [Williamsia sp. D3]